MICAKCKADIENDSFFCDQCGIQIMMCPKCGVPKTGKVCTADGTKLVPAGETSGQTGPQPVPVSGNTAQHTAPTPFVNQPVPPAPVQNAPTPLVPPQPAYYSAPAAPAAAAIPELSLVNNAVNIKITPSPGDIIGRKQGPFVPLFSAYNQVSGKHAQVNYDERGGWTITDLDSANGTQYNGVKIQPHQPLILADNSRIILANIEFIVKIAGTVDNDRTVRL